MDKPDFADTFVYGVEGPEALIEVISAAVGSSRRPGERTNRRDRSRWLSLVSLEVHTWLRK